MKVSLFLLILVVSNLYALTELRFYTNFGNFDVQTYEDKVPAPALNFINLARTKFYDGMIFQRIIEGFVNQTGDPATNGKQEVPIIEDQYHPDLIHDREGRISMAHNGPNTSTSHFAIHLDQQPHLDGGYAVFAQVIRGINVVRTINRVPTDNNDKPLSDVSLDSIRVISDNIIRFRNGSTVEFFTDWGNFEAHVYEDIVPITANNFLDLISQKYYDRMLIHRVAPDWVIQMGDPATNGEQTVPNIPEEIVPNLRHTHGGIISMASDIQSGNPGTGNSQFAIQLGASPSNDDLFSIFSEVTKGMEIVWAIGGTSVDNNEKPLEEVHLDSIRIIKYGVYNYSLPRSLRNRILLFTNGSFLFVPTSINLADLTIYDSRGLINPTQNSTVEKSDNFYFVNVSKFSPGIYFYNIRNGLNIKYSGSFIKMD